MKCKMLPRYSTTGAVSLVNLGFHHSLVGGIRARPWLPDQAKVLSLSLFTEYMKLEGQKYPANVHLPMPIIAAVDPFTVFQT